MPKILTYEEFIQVYNELLRLYFQRSNDIFISFEEWVCYEYETYYDNPIDYFTIFYDYETQNMQDMQEDLL